MRISVVVVTSALAILTWTSASAREFHGHGSREDVRRFCNERGGELLGISEFGSYGCELADGTLILCNNGNCTIYTPLVNNSKRRGIVGQLNRAATRR